MPKDSIQIKAHAFTVDDYEATIAALQTYDPQPQIEAKINLKGRFSAASLKTIIAAAEEHQAECGVQLKAEWDVGAVTQLRLFPPDYTTGTVADIEGWLNGANT